MCGILGVTFQRTKLFEFEQFRSLVEDLYLLSEIRGKESAGLAALGDGEITVLKRPIPASRFVKAPEYREVLQSLKVEKDASRLVSIIGHSRLVTNGSQEVHENNQPVLAEDIVGIHNGIVVNHDDIWKKFPKMSRKSELDSEVIFALIRQGLKEGKTLPEAVKMTFEEVYGQASIAAMLADLNCLLLYTNHGSLFTASNKAAGLMIFGSERKILADALKKAGLQNHPETVHPQKINPGHGVVVHLDEFKLEEFGDDLPVPETRITAVDPLRSIIDLGPDGVIEVAPSLPTIKPVSDGSMQEFDRFLERCREAIQQLRRCKKCLLPETMPHIRYDSDGVCNYCHNYISTKPKPIEELEEILKPHRRNDGHPDCLLGLSGGRDSCYALHVAKAELGLNPVTFTYDWGMVTDLARRNVSRMCGKLGVEHILVSANLRQKRLNVSRNVKAWLRKPDLGVIPLFMAGDKQYFYHAQRIRQEMGLNITLLGENLLERTDFKFGFCGVPPGSKDADRVYVLSSLGKSRMLWHYGMQYLTNPGYWNSSVPDTLWAYACYYMIPRDYVNMYRYVPWDEETVESTLFDEYDWELADDTKSSWRIGDGTASFYNYVYHTVAGFSELDTFRSNQIREGVMTREEAVKRAYEENQPRWPSIRAYCELIDVDFERAIRTINEIPRLYSMD